MITLVDCLGIEIQILPLEVGAHPSPDGQFDLFRMAEPYPDVACMQTPAGAVYVEAASAAPLVAAYDRLREAALPVGASLAFLSELVTHLE